MKLTIDLERSAETWVSHCLEIAVISQGPTPKSALVRLAEAVDMTVTDEIGAQERAGNANPGWGRVFANIAEEVSRRVAVPSDGTVAALVADVVAAGGALPYPGTKSEASAAPAVSNPQPEDRDLILEIIQDLDRRMSQAEAQQLAELGQQSAALWRLLERADDYLGWHVRDARVGRAP